MSNAARNNDVESRPTRRTPTQKQIATLGALDTDAIAAKAIEALHALNRRAKEMRDRRNQYRRATFSRAIGDQIDEVYRLKDRLLDALLRTGRATLFVFECPSDRFSCAVCLRSWIGNAYCRACDDATGEPETQTWFVVDCGNGYRFHSPTVAEDLRATALRTEPHDPRQPQREIPKVGLTIVAQHLCVQMATERLIRRAVTPAPTEAPFEPLGAG